jgi:MFS family permease
MITYVAIPFQVYELTRSTFVVALLGLAQIAPLLVTALIGGALADAHDRRRMVLIADAIMFVLALALLANALLAEPQVWVLFAIASGMAAAGGAAASRRRAAQLRADRRGLALRARAPGAARQLPRRHQRDAVRDAGRALPRRRRAVGGAEVLGLLFAAGPAGPFCSR